MNNLKENISIDYVIDFLNKAMETDKEAIEKLVTQRIECNKAMAEHPTIQVGKTKDKNYEYELGLLGFINGFFGVDEKGYGPISAIFDDGKLIKFVKTQHNE